MNFEQLWLEIKIKNKKSSILLGIIHQHSPQIEENMEWLNKIQTMLSIIASTFTGTIILAGDTNINLNKPSRPQKRYQEILEIYNLVQHINLPTRKGRKVIDHIITNIPNKILYSKVLPCPLISDHDAPYIVAKIPTNKY